MSNSSVIDVRTRGEFMSGHVNGSINIPLNELESHISEIKQMNKHIIVCCASGGRSAMAEMMLRNAGINCENGGSWMDVQYQFSKS